MEKRVQWTPAQEKGQGLGFLRSLEKVGKRRGGPEAPILCLGSPNQRAQDTGARSALSWRSASKPQITSPQACYKSSDL